MPAVYLLRLRRRLWDLLGTQVWLSCIVADGQKCVLHRTENLYRDQMEVFCLYFHTIHKTQKWEENLYLYSLPYCLF